MASPEEPLPGIAATLAGAHVFITGGTGFVGKAVVEKLLRGIPDLGGLYILARDKRQTTARERVDKILNDTLFARCREEQPDSLRKVTVVRGDIEEPGLGLSEEDLHLMVDKVNVVIHSAAQVRFDPHIKEALRSNLRGTQHVVEFAKKLHEVKAFIHVSTAFVNCHKLETDEQVYRPEVPAQEVMDTVEWMDDDVSAKITPNLLHGRPNTYILSKGLTEQWLADNAADLPLAIYRPSIVSSTKAEPVEGWSDSLNGPMGLVLSTGKGLMRTTIMDMRIAVDIFPVDMCANMLIAIIWKTIVEKPTDNIPIYHATSSNINPTRFCEFVPWIYENIRKHPYDVILARPWVHLNVNFPIYYMERFFLHLIPAYAYDAAMWLSGKKPRLVRIYKAIHANTEDYAFFNLHEFKWQMDSYRSLLASMCPEDRQTFDFDIGAVEWKTYWRNLVVGTKKYMLKEDVSDENLAKCRKQYITMRLRRFTWNFCLALAASRFLSRFKWIRQWWSQLMVVLQLSIQTFPILARILLT